MTLDSRESCSPSPPRLNAQGDNRVDHTHMIWMGDFNRHHPMWDLTSNSHLFTAANLDAADILINLLAEYSLTQALPHGIATLEASNTKNHTRPDNVFCSVEIEHMFTKCAVEYQLCPVKTDHFPIISTLDLQPERINPEQRPNYRDVDWDTFREALSSELETRPPPANIQSIDEFQTLFEHLTQSIARSVEEHVPKTKPSPYAKRWWSNDLSTE